MNDMKRFLVFLTPEDHKEFKMLAAKYGQSMRQIVQELIVKFIKDNKTE